MFACTQQQQYNKETPAQLLENMFLVYRWQRKNSRGRFEAPREEADNFWAKFLLDGQMRVVRRDRILSVRIEVSRVVRHGARSNCGCMKVFGKR